MEAGGLEHPSLALPKTRISAEGGAKSDARSAPSLALIIENHPELTTLIEAWPDVSPELRAAIAKMISR